MISTLEQNKNHRSVLQTVEDLIDEDEVKGLVVVVIKHDGGLAHAKSFVDCSMTEMVGAIELVKSYIVNTNLELETDG